MGDLALYGRILRLTRPYWIPLTAFTLLSLLAIPLTLLKPVPLKIAVDSVIGDVPVAGWITSWLPEVATSSGALTLTVVFAVIAIAVLSQVQGLAATLLQSYAGEKLVLDFRAQLFRHVQRLSLAHHDDVGTADSIYRIQWDAPAIQNVTVNRFVPLVTSVTTFFGMAYVMFSMDWMIAVVALVVSPVLFILMKVFRVRLRKRWRQVKKLDSSANAILEEALSSVRLVKAFGREEHEELRYMDHSGQRLSHQIQVAKMQGSFDLLINVTIACGTAAILYLCILRVQNGILTVGELLIVMSYVAQLYDPLRTMSKRVADLQSAMASAERAFALLDELPEVVESPNPKPLLRAKGDVSLQGVSFSYGNGRPVLSHVNLDVPAGSRVGIQGRSGAGKSTLISLLTRFYDVKEGKILVDGVDIREYKVADLRRQFGIVLQEAVLFSCTVRENIAYARPEASEDEIIEAAKLANAHDFISAMPEGYDTVVGERGMKLSGGERQRIALARAFVKDAPILLLDEPTSAVDTQTEGLIMEALNRLMEGRTTFMIAHRLSTLESCGLRVVLDEGGVENVEFSDLEEFVETSEVERRQ
jgi:ATP-binding cassette subfamily B protein